MSNTGFLPDEYKVPDAGGHYAKFEVGQTVVRVLSKTPLIGFVDWKGEEGSREPVRSLTKLDPISKDGPKHFWALVIYNYNFKQIQIWEITQITIMNAIKSISDNPQWGHPGRYDINIDKQGAGLKTTYTLNSNPPAKVSNEVIEAAKKISVDLDKLLSNDDPFTAVEATEVVVDPTKEGNGLAVAATTPVSTKEATEFAAQSNAELADDPGEVDALPF